MSPLKLKILLHFQLNEAPCIREHPGDQKQIDELCDDLWKIHQLIEPTKASYKLSSKGRYFVMNMLTKVPLPVMTWAEPEKEE